MQFPKRLEIRIIIIASAKQKELGGTAILLLFLERLFFPNWQIIKFNSLISSSLILKQHYIEQNNISLSMRDLTSCKF